MRPFVYVLVIAFVLLLPRPALQQNIYDLNQHNIQPEYSEFQAQSRPRVDHTGALNFSIPVGEVRGRGMDYPIT